MKNKAYIANLTNNEIALIQKYASEKFYTQPRYNTFGKHLKILNICKKFQVSSFEEIIRKVLFYNMFELNLTDDYLSYAINTAEKYSNISRIIRNQMMDFAKNTTQEFGELCTHCACFTEEELFHIVEPLIEKVKSNSENRLLFNHVDKFIDLIYENFNFPAIFENLFYVDDEIMECVNKAQQILHYPEAKLLMIIRTLIEEAFPVRLKDSLTKEDKELVNFLMYKGDEIDYMQQYNITPAEFFEKLERIYTIYDVSDINELLIKANVERDFTESGIIYDNILATIRNEHSSNNKLQQISESFEEYRDCDFTTINKANDFKSIYTELFENSEEKEVEVCT